MTQLYTKESIEGSGVSLETWQQDAFQSFGTRLTDTQQPFPCAPGVQGFLAGHMRFGFACDPREPSSRMQVASLLEAYGACAREAGPYTSLVVFFDTPTELAATNEVESFEHLFWSILNEVHQFDAADWPQQVSTDPTHATWEFCYGGEPYFAFCSTPSHLARKSRYSPYFTIAFQPRFVFANLNDDSTFGRNIKKIIRERLSTYDTVPVHPSLGWYGQQGNLEWKQYFLREDASTSAKCPFHHKEV